MSSSSVVLVKNSGSSREMDPLLRDLDDQRQHIRRNVVSLAADLRETRSRLASQEESLAKETLTRQEAEKKAESMEEEIRILNEQFQSSSSTSYEYLKELNELRSELALTKSKAESAEVQYSRLANELDERDVRLDEHSDLVAKLGEQLDILHKELHTRECSHKQLKDEVLRIEQAGWGEKMNKVLVEKDEEIALLREEIHVMTGYWKCKSLELEAQLEKQKVVDEDLKKRVAKLEYCLQVARSQTRKLQREGERRDRVLKELREELARKRQGTGGCGEKINFWESSSFKAALSMSMVILVAFARR